MGSVLCSSCGGARVFMGNPCVCTLADIDVFCSMPAPTLPTPGPVQFVVDEVLVVNILARVAGLSPEDFRTVMEKYGVDMKKAKELVKRGLVKDEFEGLTKVASGEADKLLGKKAKDDNEKAG